MIRAFVQYPYRHEGHRRKHPEVGYVVQENGCWQWTGAVTPKGYGMCSAGRAHRFYFERERGRIPDGLTLDHLCRNRGCVNPWHLEPVTNRENVLRGMGPPAQNARRTHCVHGHALTPDNLRKSQGTDRRCLTCYRARPKRWRVVSHTVCPDCHCTSVGVRADGRIVRHSVGHGAEWSKPLCPSGGKKVRHA